MSILEKSRDSNERKEIRLIFDSIDTDGNGLIDGEELRIAMRSFSSTNDEMKLTKEEINEMIIELDQDGDRRLTFEGNQSDSFRRERQLLIVFSSSFRICQSLYGTILKSFSRFFQIHTIRPREDLVTSIDNETNDQEVERIIFDG